MYKPLQQRVQCKGIEQKLKDKTWLSRVRKDFTKKFFAASTLATKNTKRKKVLEILEGMGDQAFPLTTDRGFHEDESWRPIFVGSQISAPGSQF